MRLLQIAIPGEHREAVVEVLRDRQLGYTVVPTEGEQEGDYLVQIVVPADAVEYVLEDLQDAGFDRETYTVSLDAEFAQFRDVDEVQNRWGKSPNRIAPATLRSKAKDMRLNTRSYLWMMVLSAVVACAGLLLSSPAVVVGSMVIAPIVSPSLTAIVGLVRNDRDMLVESIHLQVLGLAVAIVASVLVALLVQYLNVVPVRLEIRQMELVSPRISPSILAFAVGLAAGAAGAYGLATKGRTTIVGVMIAAALIPTAAAVGIGIAWGNYVVAVGALLLLVLNVIAINVGGAAMLFYLDYRPDEVDESLLTIHGARQALVVGGTLLFVVAVVAATGAGFYQQSSFERTVNDAVSDVLNDGNYESLGVLGLTIEYTAPGPLSNRPVVTVELSRTSDASFPELPNVMAREIIDRTDREVVVQIQYTDFDRSDAAGSAGLSAPDGPGTTPSTNSAATDPSGTDLPWTDASGPDPPGTDYSATDPPTTKLSANSPNTRAVPTDG